MDDGDWEAAAFNLVKARKKWARDRTMLLCTKVTLRTRTHFYLAIVSTALLHGSENWVLTNSILIKISAFHHSVALQLLNRKGVQDEDGTWNVASSREVMASTGMKELDFYIT